VTNQTIGGENSVSAVYSRNMEEMKRYSLSMRPRCIVYAVANGYLVQMVPQNDGQLFDPPVFAPTALGVGEVLLTYEAKEALER